MWSGVIAFTDDLLPIVGEVTRVPGYYVCLASTGFTLGPVIARMLAGHLAGQPAGAPARPLPPEYAPDRTARAPAG
jgi:glycine/D-amino acid oxidase-like deaminating enzyme